MDVLYLNDLFSLKRTERGAILYHRLTHEHTLLNGMAAAMLEAILGNRLDEWFASTTDEYDVDPDRLRDDLAEFQKSLISQAVLTPVPRSRALGLDRRSMERARIRLTNRCNLDCSHCFISASQTASGELSTEAWRQVIEQLAEFDLLELTFTGGEPLMRDDFFSLAVFANQQGMPVSINTNGMLLNEELLRQLTALNLTSVKVSLDGASPETHDARRGQGSFAVVVENIKTMIDAGIRVIVNSTITQQNFGEIREIIGLAAGMGAADCVLVECSMEGRAGEALQAVALNADQIVEMEFVKAQLNAGQQSDFIFSEDENRTVCSAGVNNFMIFANGDVAPCVPIYNTGQTAGNVRHKSVRDIWEHGQLFNELRGTHVDHIDGCCDCGHRYLCGGGCRAKAFLYSGNFAGKQYPYECAWRKKLFAVAAG